MCQVYTVCNVQIQLQFNFTSTRVTASEWNTVRGHSPRKMCKEC